MIEHAGPRHALCAAIILLIATTAAVGGEVVLSWDPSATATSYNVYRGTSSGQYGAPDNVGNTTQTSIDGLPDCTATYFAVTASNAAGESELSDEVSSWPRAVPTAADPAEAEQGSQLQLVVSGLNFRDADGVSISNPGVQIDAVSVGSCQEMTLTLTIAADAPLGPADVTVTHPSGVAGTGAGLFAVTAAADETPPEITGVDVSAVDGTSAMITWSTDEAADSRVFHRKQGDQLYQTTEVADLVTEHAVELRGLEPETTYEFHVESTDEAGNTTTTSPDEVFTTTSSPHHYIRFEAESAVLADPVRVTEGAGAFGGAWIDTPDGLPQGDAGDPLGTATHGVHLPESDTWYLWVRMYGAGSSANSWFESIDGAAREIVTSDVFDEWVWVACRAYDLDAGLHVVELAGRENKTRADRLLLTNDPEFVPTEQTDVDTTPPGAVEPFAAERQVNTVDLSWTNPADGDLARTVIRYRTDGQFPTSPADGLPLVDVAAVPGADDGYAHDVEAGMEYHYSAFAIDGAGNVSAAAHATPGTGTPPPPENVDVY